MQRIDINDALRSIGRTIWYAVFRDGREMMRVECKELHPSDILVAGLESSGSVRAWTVLHGKLVPVSRRKSDLLTNAPSEPSVRRRFTDTRLVPATARQAMGKVLIVDDHEDSRECLTYMLSSEGYQVASASSGQEAICVAEKILPEAIVLDLVMPGMGGTAVAAAIRKVPSLSATRIIAYSGMLTERLRNEALTMGCDKFLAKPAEPAELLGMLHRAFTLAPKVLLVDDDLDKRRYCTSVLRSDGYAVLESFCGEHALNILDRVNPDMVLSDARLGDTDGYELCAEIKRRRSVPVVLVSMSPENGVKAAASRIDGYVNNLGQPESLLDKVREHVH